MALIDLLAVRVSYPVFVGGRPSSLLRKVAQSASFGLIGGGPAGTMEHVQALRGITLDLHDGDRLGVIGRNGAGKSTLLRVIAGVNWPQAGVLRIEGKVSSLLSVGAGIDLEKTGLQNVNFVGSLMGLGRKERLVLAEDIATFTELGRFLDFPVRTYSSGMAVRLAFALATAFPAEILVVDEVIGAGDSFFMERALERSRRAYQNTRILVMASHSSKVLQEYCNIGVWLDRGVIVDHGPIDEVLERYAVQEPRFPDGVPQMSRTGFESTRNTREPFPIF